MRLDDLAGATVLVLGLGIDNLAALDAVLAAGPGRVLAAVDDPGAASVADRDRMGALDIVLIAAENAIDAGREAGAPLIVLRAPGYPRRGEVCTRLEDAGAVFTTAVDLWIGTHGAARPIVAITGTKGKSTVTALLDSLLDLLGIEHLMGGNIGLAIWAEASNPPPGVPAVIEVSSYMAADAHHAPTIGVLTSLDADHLTWHGSIERYRSDKLRLFSGGEQPPQVVLVDGGDPVALKAIGRTGLPVQVVDPGSGLASAAGARLAERGFPRHLRSNLALAAAAAERLCDLLGLGDVPLDGALTELADHYVALPSRHATIGEHRGVRYIDDALASNPFAAAAALDAVGEVPVTWLIGGQSRDVSLAPMAAALAQRRSPTLLLGLPDTGEAWCAQMAGPSGSSGSSGSSGTGVGDTAAQPVGLDALAVADVGEAVRIAATRTPEDGVVLFAPGAPTPSRLGTYHERAADFAAAFAALSGG